MKTRPMKLLAASAIAFLLSAATGLTAPTVSVVSPATAGKPYNIKSADLGRARQILVENTLDVPIEVEVTVDSVVGGYLPDENAKHVVRVAKPKELTVLFNVMSDGSGSNPSLTYTDTWRYPGAPKAADGQSPQVIPTVEQVNSRPPVFTQPSPYKTMQEALSYAQAHPGEWVNAPNGRPVRFLGANQVAAPFAAEREAFIAKYNKEHPEGGAEQAWAFELRRLQAEKAEKDGVNEIRMGRDGKVVSERKLTPEETAKFIRPLR